MKISPLVLPNQGFAEQISLRHFQTEDAPAIANLFLAVYGEAYPAKIYYEPSQLIQANLEERTISFIAQTQSGEIVGHLALYLSAPSTKVYEMGAGLILPAYRMQNLFTPLLQYTIDYITKTSKEIIAIFGEAVCNHVKTQKSIKGIAMKESALGLDAMPIEAYSQEQSATGRVSTLITFLVLHPKPHKVYIPITYQTEAYFIYEGLGEKRQFIYSDASMQPNGENINDVKVQVYPFAQLARLAVTQAAADFDEHLLACEAEARRQCAAEQQTVQVFQCWLSLIQPHSEWLVARLREHGYFFGGILPYWFEHDALLMQKINYPPQWEQIELLSQRGKELCAFVHNDWKSIKSIS